MGNTGRASFWPALKADTIRLGGKYSLGVLVFSFLARRTFRPIFTMRACQLVNGSKGLSRLFLPFFKALHCLTTHAAAMDFPWSTSVGPGLCITHGWGLVVNRNVIIGKNVTLFHGVTLGQRNIVDPQGDLVPGYPVIEDEVWIGPHAIVVGHVVVGRGSRIAGGAFVTESVPAHTAVGGNPATVMKRASSPDVDNPAPV